MAFAAAASACIERSGLPDAKSAHRATESQCAVKPFGEARAIQSAILGQSRQYWVHLPPSYDSETALSKKYPVLYLLDGDTFFIPAVGVVHAMSAGGANHNYQIPELIVVAISSANRERDYTPSQAKGWDASGGADKFLAFVENELVPTIDAKYRSIRYRILAGHSLGGLCAITALLTSPPKFNATIAMDPSLWWDDLLMFKKLEQMKGALHFPGHTAVYISTYGAAKRRAEYLKFAEDLKNRKPDAPRIAAQVFESETHGSLPLLSLYYGLLFIFKGYQPSFDGPDDGISILREHFSEFSKQIGFEYLPPEDLIQELCKHTSKSNAIACWTLNVSIYPDSTAARNALARAIAEP